jgi:hypothetical protein
MLMRCPRLILAAVAVPALAIPLGCGRGDGTKLTLRYHPPAGVSYHYTLEQQSNMKFAGGPMGKMPDQQISLHMHFTQTATGPTAEGVAVSVRFDSTSMESPLMAQGAFGPALDRMRGLTSNVVYDQRMNVIHAEFINAGTPSPITEQLAKNLKGMTFPLAEAPVGVGDSWTADVELPISQSGSGGPPTKATTKLTVKEIHAGGSDTTVMVALETTFPKDPIKVMQQGQVITVTLSGDMTGEQEFSVTRGAVLHSLMGGTMRIKMTGGMLGADGTNMTMKQSTSLWLQKPK